MKIQKIPKKAIQLARRRSMYIVHIYIYIMNIYNVYCSFGEEYWCDVSNLLKSNFSSLFGYPVCRFTQKTMPLLGMS